MSGPKNNLIQDHSVARVSDPDMVRDTKSICDLRFWGTRFIFGLRLSDLVVLLVMLESQFLSLVRVREPRSISDL